MPLQSPGYAREIQTQAKRQSRSRGVRRDRAPTRPSQPNSHSGYDLDRRPWRVGTTVRDGLGAHGSSRLAANVRRSGGRRVGSGFGPNLSKVRVGEGEAPAFVALDLAGWRDRRCLSSRFPPASSSKRLDPLPIPPRPVARRSRRARRPRSPAVQSPYGGDSAGSCVRPGRSQTAPAERLSLALGSTPCRRLEV